MASIFNRIVDAKRASGKCWDQIAKEANIPLSSWMTGVPYAQPTDEDLKRIAPVINTTYEWLKHGKK